MLPNLIPLHEACALARTSIQGYRRAVKRGILPRPISITGPALVDRDKLVTAIQRQIELAESRPVRQWRRRAGA